MCRCIYLLLEVWVSTYAYDSQSHAQGYQQRLCLFSHTTSREPMQLRSPNLCTNFLLIHLFLGQKVKGQGDEVQINLVDVGQGSLVSGGF